MFKYNPDKKIAFRQGLTEYVTASNLADTKYLNEYLNYGIDPNVKVYDGNIYRTPILCIIANFGLSSSLDENSERRLKAIKLLLAFKADPNVVCIYDNSTNNLLSEIDGRKNWAPKLLSDAKKDCQDGKHEYYCEKIPIISKNLEILGKIEEAAIKAGATREIKVTKPGHLGEVSSVCFSPDGKFALSGGA